MATIVKLINVAQFSDMAQLTFAIRQPSLSYTHMQFLFCTQGVSGIEIIGLNRTTSIKDIIVIHFFPLIQLSIV